MTKPKGPAGPAAPGEAAPPDSQLDNLLAQLSPDGGYLARVHRIDPRDGEAAYLDRIELTPDLVDTIKARWGGGRYRVRVVDVKGTYRGGLLIPIAGLPIVDQLAAVPGAVAAAAAVPSNLDRILERLIEGQAALTAALAQRPAAPDPIELMTRTATALKDMAAIHNPPAAARAPVDPLDMIEKFFSIRDRVLQDTPAGGGDSLATAIHEGTSGLFQLWNRKLEHDEKVLEMRNRRRITAPVTSAPGGPSATSPTATETVSTPGATSDVDTLHPVMAMAQRIPMPARLFLLNQARTGKDPTLYADVVLDALSDEDAAAIVGLSAREDFLNSLCAAIPAWTPYAEWFGLLVKEMVDAVSADGDASDDAGGQVAQSA